MDKKTIRELRSKAQSIPATVHIGKEGITASVEDELRRQLEKSKLVKARVLRSFEGPMGDVGQKLANASESFLVEVRGRTVVLARD